MARNYPANDREFSRISGVGEKKLQEFGEIFLTEIAAHLQSNPRQIFADEMLAPPPPKPRLNDTTSESLRLFRDGMSVEEIARKRNLVMSTIYTHFWTALEAGEPIEVNRLFSAEQEEEISAAFAKYGFSNLGGVRESLGNRFDYGLLRIFRAARQRE